MPVYASIAAFPVCPQEFIMLPALPATHTINITLISNSDFNLEFRDCDCCFVVVQFEGPEVDLILHMAACVEGIYMKLSCYLLY